MESSKTYQKLGALTFWIFVLENSLIAIVPFCLFFVALILRMIGIGDIVTNLSGGTQDGADAINLILNWGILAMLVFFVLGTLLAFTLAIIDYFTYSFVLDENDLRIKRGIINTEETSIPYRQIQNVDIERPLLYQILGASRLVILTAGHSDNNDEGDIKDDSEGMLPAIGKKFAEELREDLLLRTNVQKVTEVKSPETLK